MPYSHEHVHHPEDGGEPQHDEHSAPGVQQPHARAGHVEQAAGHARAEHGAHDERVASGEQAGHDKHAGHSVAMFRQKFWGTLLLSIPTVIWAPMIQKWFGYSAPGGPAASRWISAVFGTLVFAYGGWVFIRGGTYVTVIKGDFTNMNGTNGGMNGTTGAPNNMTRTLVAVSTDGIWRAAARQRRESTRRRSAVRLLITSSAGDSPCVPRKRLPAGQPSLIAPRRERAQAQSVGDNDRRSMKNVPIVSSIRPAA